MFEAIREACKWEVPEMELEQYWSGNPFTDRDSYFEWVRQWKATYKNLTQEIRGLKAQIRDPESQVPNWQCQRQRHRLRLYATALLILRRAGKAHSWKMKQEQLEKVS